MKQLLMTALMAAALSTTAHAQTAPAKPAAVTDAEARAATKKIGAKRIILVGDSTTAVQGGWGPSFCGYHLTSFVVCLNLARGGRSSWNYRAEGSWDIVLKELEANSAYGATYVLIQFGHNDQPGKPGRSTDLPEYGDLLRAYVTETRATGAIPVLVTPLTRRGFTDGKLQDDLTPWAEATRTVAAEMNVPLVDLYARSQEAVQAMGPVESFKLAQKPPSTEVYEAGKTGTTIPASTGVPPAPNSPALTPEQINASVEPMGQAKLSFDYTHIGREGADFFATLVTRELAKAVPELKRDLIP